MITGQQQEYHQVNTVSEFSEFSQEHGSQRLVQCGGPKHYNVGIAIMDHPPNHHFYGWEKPSKIGGL